MPFFETIDMLESGLVDAIVTTVPHYLHYAVGDRSIEQKKYTLIGEKTCREVQKT